MRLLVISTMRGYTWAGSEELWASMAQLALQRDHNVKGLFHEEMVDGGLIPSLRRQGMQVGTWSVGRLPRLEKLKQFIRPNFSQNLSHEVDYVLVSVGSPTALLTVPGLSELLLGRGVRYSVLVQFNADCLQISNYERTIIRQILQRSERVIFVSRNNWKTTERQFNLVLEKRANCIHNPVRVIVEGPIPFPPQGPLRLACVARLETYWKCQDILLEVVSGPLWRDRDFELRLYGTGPDAPYLSESIRRLNLEGRARLMGHETDLQRIWTENHALVLPSRGEGMPLAALEAMMHGRPVIATRAGGISEIVIDGLSGYLSDGDDVLAIRNLMERAYADRDRWATVGLAGHLQARASKVLDPGLILLQIIENTFCDATT